MENSFHTDGYEFEYIESNIDTTLLWESHCHARFEMIAVLEGDISIMLEGKSYRLTEGQSVIIPPLAYHTITANKRGFYRRVTALFDLEVIPAVLQSRFLQNGKDIAIFSSPQIEELKIICKKEDPSLYAPLAQSLMIKLFYDNLRARESNNVTEADEFLQKTVMYIDQHLDEKILLEDLARHTSRSKSSFCHLFEEKMNISPKQYILQKKLALANKLIVDGTPPTVAAIRVGYDNYSNFYRMYHKHFGSSPSKRNTVE